MTSREVLPLLLLLLLLIAPTTGAIIPNPVGIKGNEEITVEGTAVTIDTLEIGPDLAISDIFVYGVAPGTTVHITVGRPGETYTGSFSYQSSGAFSEMSNMTLALGDGHAFWRQLAVVKFGASFCIRYANNTDAGTTGIALSDVPPWHQDYLAYQPVPWIASAPLTSVSVSTDNGDPITVRVRYNSVSEIEPCVENYGKNLPPGGLLGSAIDFVTLLTDFFVMVLSIVTILIAVFKYVFVDHFIAVVVLYESILIGYTASNSRSLVQFVSKFVKSNERLFAVILKFISFVLDSLYKMVQAVKPI